MTEKHPCVEIVWHQEGNWGQNYPCQRNGTRNEDGRWWCASHSPEKVLARRKATSLAVRAELDAAAKDREVKRLRDAVVDAAKAWLVTHGPSEFSEYASDEVFARVVEALVAFEQS